MSEQEAVYVTEYYNKYPDDGYELGGAYATEALAHTVAEQRLDADYRWSDYSVSEFVVRGRAENQDAVIAELATGERNE